MLTSKVGAQARVMACCMQGSFGSGTFAAYAPATKEVELCDVPEEED